MSRWSAASRVQSSTSGAMHDAPQASALAFGCVCARSGTRPPCINIKQQQPVM